MKQPESSCRLSGRFNNRRVPAVQVEGLTTVEAS